MNMKLADWPGSNELRFDTELKSFDSLISLILNSRERIKASGKKVVAKNPLCPAEPIFAANGLAYDPCTHQSILHATTKENINLVNKAKEMGLSWDSNPWYLIMLGAFASGKNEIDIDAFSAACGNWDDQIKRSWQLMAGVSESPLNFWDVPRFDIQSEEWALKYLVKELGQLFDWLTIQTGHKITNNNLLESIKYGNLLRQDLIEITQMLQLPKVPVSALEYYLAQTMIDDYAQEPGVLHDRYRALIQELKERASRSLAASGLISEKPLRIYFMGEETQVFRVWNAIEDYGGVLVGCDTRLSLYYELIEENGSAIENLARWIWRMPSNLPTADRVKATIPYIKQQKPDAVIISSITGSRNLPESERFTLDIIGNQLDLPVLRLETALPPENIEPINNQIRDFIRKYSV